MSSGSTGLPVKNIFEGQGSIGTEAPVDFVSQTSSTEPVLKLTQTTIQLGERRPATDKLPPFEGQEEPPWRDVRVRGLQRERVKSYP